MLRNNHTKRHAQFILFCLFNKALQSVNLRARKFTLISPFLGFTSNLATCQMYLHTCIKLNKSRIQKPKKKGSWSKSNSPPVKLLVDCSIDHWSIDRFAHNVPLAVTTIKLVVLVTSTLSIFSSNIIPKLFTSKDTRIPVPWKYTVVDMFTIFVTMVPG